jgi:antitoxin PrlF
MSITKVTRNNQITVPSDIRELAQIKEGDKLIMSLENDEIKIKKIDEDIFEKTFGSWKKLKSTKEFITNVRSGWEERKKRLKI